jgi:COP9 signalosome complex subunit 2
VLKYLVLTTMLMGSDIDPFESPETKPYKNDHRISAMTDLVTAYQRDEIHRYESILDQNKDLLEDPFIAENIDEVTRNMRTKAVQKLVAPYTRFTIAFVAKQLKISVAEVQDIIGFLVVDKKIKGKINQERGIVELESNVDAQRTDAMSQWASALDGLWNTVLWEGEGFKPEESAIMGPSTPSGFGGPQYGEGGRGGSRGGLLGKMRSGAKKPQRKVG